MRNVSVDNNCRRMRNGSTGIPSSDVNRSTFRQVRSRDHDGDSPSGASVTAVALPAVRLTSADRIKMPIRAVELHGDASSLAAAGLTTRYCGKPVELSVQVRALLLMRIIRAQSL